MKKGSTIMRINLTGMKSGRLTVVGFSHRAGECKSRALYWLCACECGNSITARTHALKSGHTQSCGCLQRDRTSESSSSHRMTGTAEHKAWIAMRQRCINPADAGYKNYGGRGITVDQRWEDFEIFLRDMGRRPSSRHSLERVDNSAGYGPSNCIWTTRKAQNNNTRQNVRITIAGVTRTLAQWSEASGISYQTLRKRRRLGWTGMRLLESPSIYLNRGHRGDLSL